MNSAIFAAAGALNLAGAALVLGYHAPIGLLPAIVGLICLAGIE